MNNIFRIAVLATALLFSITSAAYPNVSIHNDTEYKASATVTYQGCPSDYIDFEPGQTVTVKSRGFLGWCLVLDIYGSLHGSPVSLDAEKKEGLAKQLSKKASDIKSYAPEGRKELFSYVSDGTGYSKFFIKAFGGGYKILSEAEDTALKDKGTHKSPGFRFENNTIWPVAFSLDQVGCLHHAVIPAATVENGKLVPGVFNQDTGAVWFTLRASIKPDGADHGEWECAQPIVDLVVQAALTVATAGSVTGLVGASNLAKVAATSGFKAANIAYQAGKAVSGAQWALSIAKTVSVNTGKLIAANLGEDYQNSLGFPNTDVVLYGQYAGYSAPFQCDAMPIYEITGGPVFNTTADGELVLESGMPFSIRKTNTCGNNMMFGSLTAATTETYTVQNNTTRASPFPKRPMTSVRIEYDCALGGIDFENTNSPLMYVFYQGNKEVQRTLMPGGAGTLACGHHSLDALGRVEIELENRIDASLISAVEIRNEGKDPMPDTVNFINSFMIDELDFQIIKYNRGCTYPEARTLSYARPEIEFFTNLVDGFKIVHDIGTYTFEERKLKTAYIEQQCWENKTDERVVARRHHGAEGGKGFCLNSSAKLPSIWTGKAEGCHVGVKFNMNSDEAWVVSKSSAQNSDRSYDARLAQHQREVDAQIHAAKAAALAKSKPKL
jgi:hypothetical protein